MTAKETKKVSDSGGGVEIFFFLGWFAKVFRLFCMRGAQSQKK